MNNSLYLFVCISLLYGKEIEFWGRFSGTNLSPLIRSIVTYDVTPTDRLKYNRPTYHTRPGTKLDIL